jgi:hypothetical protein
VIAPTEVFSTPYELIPGVAHTFEIPVVVDLVSGADEGNLAYTVTYSLDFNAGNHFLGCNNIDPAWLLPTTGATILKVRPPPGRAHIEAVTFSPTTVNGGQPSDLTVIVHHGIRMGGKRIQVQVDPQGAPLACVTTPTAQQWTTVVPKNRVADGVITAVFRFSTTSDCQGQVRYKASMVPGQNIQEDPPIDDADPLTVSPPPQQPKLEIIAPGRDTTLYIKHRVDGFPVRPRLENVSVKVTGVTPDPTPTTTFRWKVRFQYETRTKTVRQTEAFWEEETRGGTLPADITDRCGTIVGQLGGDGTHRACVAGGNVLFEARATINGQEIMASKEGPRILAENNPGQETVRAYIDELSRGDPEKAIWLKRIACQESQQGQFYATTVSASPSIYRYPGEPVWNSIGDGGVGIMQITNTNRVERPSPAEIWDWRANVEEGVRVFNIDKRDLVENYLRALPNDQDFKDMVTRTNQWRRSQNLPVLRVIVPDYSTAPFRMYQVREPALNGQRVQRDMLVEDTIRGFNGFLPASFIRNGRGGQFGLPWHEFRLWTRNVSIGEIFELVNERRDPTNPTRSIADAVWERIPLADRPQDCKDCGDPNYVNHVRCADPQCLGQKQADPLCR